MKEVIIMHQCPLDMFSYTVEPGDSMERIAGRFNSSINLISMGNSGINSDNLSVGQVICIPSWSPNYYYSQSIAGETQYSRQEVELMNEIRKLWEEHIIWTRMTIMSIVENAPDEDLVTKRLLRNPSDFAMLLKALYGEEIASKFEKLFTQHLVIAAQLVKAAKSGDKIATADAEQRWYANADEIAAFLASINPYWTEKMWKEMLYEHLALTKEEAINRINQSYAADILVFDKIQNQALKMADIMSEGIIHQFPDKF